MRYSWTGRWRTPLAGVLTLMVLLTTACGTAEPSGPEQPTAGRLTIDADTLTSDRALAHRLNDSLTFVDPVTGQQEEQLTLVEPEGVTDVEVRDATLLDTESETLAVFFYQANHPPDGLSPRRSEARLQVHSRATGQPIHDAAVRLPAEVADRGWSGVELVGTDPRGYAAFGLRNPRLPVDHPLLVVALQPHLRGWTATDRDCCARVAALAVGAGVLLTSRLTSAAVELRGYDVATGRPLWTHRYAHRAKSADHPQCAVPRDDTFVVMGRHVPLVVRADTGETVVARTGNTCMQVDPLGSTAVATDDGVAGYDLADGRRLWHLPPDQTTALRLRVHSVYQDRVYVSTETERLVLDALAGREVARDWELAPYRRHDGWFAAYTPLRLTGVAYPGTGPTPEPEPPPGAGPTAGP
ncbi:PQQ-binding-like beta-propeller repeat protein [Solwaraspora sp. WMMD1047]|uniref:outer membrane protein assembly factor BamB family protein n=1 Tax=Solwaraspora sp. WMMD1047 TaxID=3016102 RepID=UPI002415AE26|nr:PQQ-binding-like beta-propeller repeat protein [Solwaraspora sp. WMMD1047]MDG4830508.1 PQQ-binding-like beta-propeller repeat protein [Solwaraspora sp. WMMD1047]